jgi:hypothetical protein
MNMSDTLELPTRNDKLLCLGEKGARVSDCMLLCIASE